MSGSEEVILCGGGIAGLAAAIALRQRGVEVRVLEQAPAMEEIGAGLLLGPNACAVLEKLGALEPLLARGPVPVSQWQLRNWNGELLSGLNIPRPGELSLSTRRSDLQHALLSCLPAEAILTGHAVTGARLTAEGVTVTVAGKGEIAARRIIVADGAHSRARASLWPGREPRYCGYVGWRGLVAHVPAGWEGERVSESWGFGRRFGISPVGNGRLYWYASANVPERDSRKRIGLAELRRDFSRWHDPVREILEAMPEEDLLQHPISDRRPGWTWQREEKAVLLGDAAHPLTPNLGQGASMALEDAWELAAVWGRTHAMETFEQRRRARVLRLWAISRWFGKMIQWENPGLCALRDAQIRMTPDSLATAAMRRLLRYEPTPSDAR